MKKLILPSIVLIILFLPLYSYSQVSLADSLKVLNNAKEELFQKSVFIDKQGTIPYNNYDVLYRFDFTKEKKLVPNQWLEVNNIQHTDIGYIIPFDSKIIFISFLCTESHNSDVIFEIYSGDNIIYQFTLTAGDLILLKDNLDINIDAGNKLRCKAVFNKPKKISNVILSIYLKRR